MSHGTITDDGLAELEVRIGAVIKDRPQPHIEETTKDAIRHFAWGMGDDNPLWLDPDHAQRGIHGGILAPPCILYATDRIVSGYVGGLPGVHALFAGTDWTWHTPIRVNDRIDAEPALQGVEIKDSRFAVRAVKQTYHVKFTNQHDQLVAEADSWCFRTERATARDVGKYSEVRTQSYTPAEIEAVAEAYRSYRRQGESPLLWSDVEQGQSLPELVKGPLTVTGMIAWDQGWGGLYIRADALAFQMFDDHPALAIPNHLGIPDVPERVHWEAELATAIGAPGPYDYGPERITWLSQLMTDFIGDAGFLKRLGAQVRRFNVVGDITYCRGTVVNKYIDDDGQHLIDCSLEAVNQRGETTAHGLATAVLPSG